MGSLIDTLPLWHRMGSLIDTLPLWHRMGSLIDHLPPWVRIVLICIAGYVAYEITLFIRQLVLEELARRQEEEDADQ